MHLGARKTISAVYTKVAVETNPDEVILLTKLNNFWITWISISSQTGEVLRCFAQGVLYVLELQ